MGREAAKTSTKKSLRASTTTPGSREAKLATALALAEDFPSRYEDIPGTEPPPSYKVAVFYGCSFPPRPSLDGPGKAEGEAPAWRL